MSELFAGARVCVVMFDEAGLTGSVYTNHRSPVGRVGTVIRHEPEFPECPWVVDLDDASDSLLPDRFLHTELEVLDAE